PSYPGPSHCPHSAVHRRSRDRTAEGGTVRMAMSPVHCSCGELVQAATHASGQALQCPRCGQSIAMPPLAPPSPPPPAAHASPPPGGGRPVGLVSAGAFLGLSLPGAGVYGPPLGGVKAPLERLAPAPAPPLAPVEPPPPAGASPAASGETGPDTRQPA